MLKPGDQHLTEEEIERLSRTRQTATSAEGEDSGDAATKHLSECADCRLRLEQAIALNHKLVSLRATASQSRSHSCPPESEWVNLAAGLKKESDSRHMLEHAANCDYCGPLLSEATALLSEESPAEERALLGGLESAKESWRAEMAKRLAATSQARLAPQTKHSADSSWWKNRVTAYRLPWTLGVAAATAALVVWTAARFFATPDVDTLLASAYTEQRTMELRFPGATYAPVRQERSTGGSTLDQPQALLDADALIGKQLKTHPDDPRWLQAKGRADLLAFRYEAAIPTFERALNQRPNSPSLLTDLASAYFQRGSANNGREVDFGLAVDLLGRSLAVTPDDPVSLFNRAIAEEKLHLYRPAVDDWKHYLRVDPAGPWSDEGRKRLKEVDSKLQSKESSLSAPLLDDVELSALSSSRLPEELQERVEDYLHAAVKKWLPRAYPQASQSDEVRRGQTRASLRALAEVTKNRHADTWLTDLLHDARGANFEKAVTFLAEALEANDTGNYAQGRSASRQASKLFRTGGNTAGELRAQLEELYSDHLLYDGHRCMNLARKLRPQLQVRAYQWMRAEADLEESNCAALNGHLGEQRIAIDRGTSEARQHDYLALFIRGTGFQADVAGSLGDVPQGFSLASKGLNVFWSTKIDLMKGYNLYTDLDTGADLMRLPRLQVALWHQAVELIDLHPDLLQRAMAHRWFANSAYLANIPQLASVEFAKASSLFAEASPTEATVRGQMDADVWLAGLKARQGELTSALDLLRQVKSNLDRVPSFGPEIGYYTTLADVKLRTNDREGIESSLRSAIYLAEWALRTFPSDTDRRHWAKQSEQAYRNLVVWKLRQGDARGALEYWEWYKGAELRTTRTHGQQAFEGLEESIPPDAQFAPALDTPSVVADQLPALQTQTIITYAAFPEGTAVWVYDDRGIVSRWIASDRNQLELQSEQFHRLCSSPDANSDKLRQTAQVLYDLLIAPIQDQLVRGRRLVFELDDVLSPIPMEALVDHDGKYLIERSEVANTPSLYHILNARPAMNLNVAAHALVVGVSGSGLPGVTPISDAEHEAEMVAQSFRSPRLLEGVDATLPRIHREMSSASIFHFAGHAIALPEMSGLVLGDSVAESGRATLLNSENLQPEMVRRLQLAVLSACDTGTIQASRNSGSEGIALAFLRYGVPRVVASQWKVDSAGTTLLMQRFYQRLTNGNDSMQALHDAKLTLAADSRFSHPYYWAPFQMFE